MNVTDLRLIRVTRTGGLTTTTVFIHAHMVLKHHTSSSLLNVSVAVGLFSLFVSLQTLLVCQMVKREKEGIERKRERERESLHIYEHYWHSNLVSLVASAVPMTVMVVSLLKELKKY